MGAEEFLKIEVIFSCKTPVVLSSQKHEKQKIKYELVNTLARNTLPVFQMIMKHLSIYINNLNTRYSIAFDSSAQHAPGQVSILVNKKNQVKADPVIKNVLLA